MIIQVILAFWLVLAYDLQPVLEDRCTIDIIITKFFPLCFKMAERFENLDNILRVWVKDKVQKSLEKALNRFKKQEEERQSQLFKKMIQKKYSSSHSQQSNETKPSTKLVLVSQDHLHYLALNKPKKQNVSEINLFKKSSNSHSQNNCWHTDWCQEWNIKTSLLKIS